MALVTVQRSPSPSTDHDAESLSEDTTDGKSHLKKRLKTSKKKLRKVISSVRFLSKLRPGLSERYFACKGAALILPYTECTKKSSKKSHGGEIQDHLQAMLLLLRTEDQIKIAVRLEDETESVYKRYICVVATRGRQDTEEAVILGMDCRHGEAVIGLVLPIWLGVKIQLEGDGGFRLWTDGQAYLFNPVSVQAMWSAIQSLIKVVHKAEEMKYIHDGLTHTWVEYYRSRIDHGHVANDHYWNAEGVYVFAPKVVNEEDEPVLKKISNALKEVMMSFDLDEVSCRDLRIAVEERLGFSIKTNRAFFDEEMIRIFGQMEGPAKILDYLYLGSEWNASNLEELQTNGVGYILNVTKEIDNFFAGTFHYYTVRVTDEPQSDLLKHWDKTFKFISKARSHGSKVFVHCKMGISRSASTVMAYLMKENRWGVDEAYKFVKERRTIAKPNSGFLEQLQMYEAILSASNKRDYFRTKASDNQPPSNDEGMSGEQMMDQDYDCMLGDSMMNVMAAEWANVASSSASLEEDLGHLQYGSKYFPMGPDLEGTESRSGDSLEESIPDMSSPPHSEKPKSTIGDGAPDQASGVIPSSGPFKVKPDSFWIKQEEDTMSSEENSVEMKEEFDSESSSYSQSTTSTATKMDPHVLKPASKIKLENKLNPSSLSENDSKDQISSMSLSNPQNDTISYPSTTGASSPPLIPDLMSQISAHDIHSSSSISLPTVPMEDVKIQEKDVITRSTMADKNSVIKACEGDSMQHSISKDNTSISSQTGDVFNSMQSKDGTERAAIITKSLPSSNVQGKLESGVQDYFIREKIPWNPGKVQKIREGIDRVGFIGGDLVGDAEDTKEDERMEVVVNDDCPQCVTGHVKPVTEEDDPFKMDIDKEKIILDECMEISSPKIMHDSPVVTEENNTLTKTEVGGALSLYEKEEIHMEPGTVLRTRMEIEERQKFSTGDGDPQNPSSPTKPVLRTSSLKATSNKDSQQVTSNPLPRRVSCGPIMEKMRHLKHVENDNVTDDELVMEEDTHETEIIDAMSVQECEILVDMGKTESKIPHTHVDLGIDLNSESCTDPDKAGDNTGIVKSFVRKIEKHPPTESKTSPLIETCMESNVLNSCDDIQSKVPPGQHASSFSYDHDAKIDLDFVGGESSTDSHLLQDEFNQKQDHEDLKSDATKTRAVRHLVGQFEIKTPLEGLAKVFTDTDNQTRDDHRPTESSPLKSGDNKFVTPGETAENTFEKLSPISTSISSTAQSCSDSNTSLSFGQHTASSGSCAIKHPETNVSNTAESSHSLPQLKSSTDDAYSSKEDRFKEVWTPYQSFPPESTSEDISSLRQKFENNEAKEERGQGQQIKCQSMEKNRKLPRPKSVERICGMFEGKSKSETSLSGDRKEDAVTSLRQVSEEGRKVRRLHGKSHPLTKLSQGRGVFHSSM